MPTAGMTSSGVPRSPVTSSTGVTNTGPSAIPRLPPTENQLIAWVEFPATPRAVRVASGWYAATPTPDSAMASQVIT